jgi:hypothetical protein
MDHGQGALQIGFTLHASDYSNITDYYYLTQKVKSRVSAGPTDSSISKISIDIHFLLIS